MKTFRKCFGWLLDPYCLTLVPVIAASVIALKVVENITLPTAPMYADYARALDYIVNETRITLAVLLAVFAFVGTVLRAGAHKLGKDRKRDVTDFLGKLFAVLAASLAFWVAVLAVPDPPFALDRIGLVIVGTACLIILLLAGKALWWLARQIVRKLRQPGAGAPRAPRVLLLRLTPTSRSRGAHRK